MEAVSKFIHYMWNFSSPSADEQFSPPSRLRPIKIDLLQKLKSANPLFFYSALSLDYQDLEFIYNFLLSPSAFSMEEEARTKRIIKLIDEYNPSFAGTLEKSKEMAIKIFDMRKPNDQALIKKIQEKLESKDEAEVKPVAHKVIKEPYFEPLRKKQDMAISTPQERRIPPNGAVTAVCHREGRIERVYKDRTVFHDGEIMEKLNFTRKVTIGNSDTYLDIDVFYTQNGKAIIQQIQATRGAPGPAIAMLLVDNDKFPGRPLMNLAYPYEGIASRVLEKAGLKPIISHIGAIEELRKSHRRGMTEYRYLNDKERKELEERALRELRELIEKDGSAFVTFGEDHDAVVVDQISSDLTKVRLRDPYHGWEITVKAEAFVKEWQRYQGINRPDEQSGPFVLQVAREQKEAKTTKG